MEGCRTLTETWITPKTDWWHKSISHHYLICAMCSHNSLNSINIAMSFLFCSVRDWVWSSSNCGYGAGEDESATPILRHTGLSAPGPYMSYYPGSPYIPKQRNTPNEAHWGYTPQERILGGLKWWFMWIVVLYNLLLWCYMTMWTLWCELCVSRLYISLMTWHLWDFYTILLITLRNFIVCTDLSSG